MSSTIFFYGFTVVYLVTRVFEIFVTLFTLGVVLEIVMSAYGGSKSAAVTRSRNVAVVAITVARIAWETERHGCEYFPWLWPLHMVWHVLTCLSAYYTLCYSYYYRYDTLGPSGVVASGAPTLPLRQWPLVPAAWLAAEEALSERGADAQADGCR